MSLYRPGRIAVLRVPALPWSVFVEWCDSAHPVGWLEKCFSNPDLLAALRLSSPTLASAIERPGESDQQGRRRRTNALAAYLSRMCGRATPFGGLASFSTVTVAPGAPTRLPIEAVEFARLHIDIDVPTAFEAAARARSELVLDDEVELVLNPSVLVVPGEIWVFPSGLPFSGERIRGQRNPALDQICGWTREGLRLGELCSRLCKLTATGPAQARDYVEDLVDSGFLVPRRTCFTTQVSLAPLASALGPGGTELLAALSAGQKGVPMRELEGEFGVRLGKEIARIGGKPGGSLSCCLRRQATGASIDADLCAQIERAALITAGLHSVAPARMASVAQWLEGRFAGEPQPLLALLGSELGAAWPEYDINGHDDTWSRWVPDSSTVGSEPVWQYLPPLAGGKDARANVELDKATIDAALTRAATLPLPLVASARIELYGKMPRCGGSPTPFWFVGMAASAAARLCSRFAPHDPRLSEELRLQQAVETRANSHAITAEIAWLAPGAFGNVLRRQCGYPYEIICGALASVSAEHRLYPDDLWLRVRDGRLVLQRGLRGSEILPRLSAPVSPLAVGTGLVRFLCDLAHQDSLGGISWQWGNADQNPSTPRVVAGPAILTPAIWRLDRAATRSLRRAPDTAWDTICRFRERHAVHRYVAFFEEGNDDQPLLADLDSRHSVKMLVHAVRSAHRVHLRELPGLELGLPARDAKAEYFAQLDIPLTRAQALEPSAVGPLVIQGSSSTSTHPPGSQWLSAHLKIANAQQDAVLCGPISTFVQRSRREGTVSRWFFVRLGPELRVRFQLPHANSWVNVAKQLCDLLSEAAREGGWDWSLQSYRPEFTRYGGSRGVEVAEAWFDLDSNAILDELARPQQRDPIAIACQHFLHALKAFPWSWRERVQALDHYTDMLARERGCSLAAASIAMDKLFRSRRRWLDALLEPALDISLQPTSAQGEATVLAARILAAAKLDQLDVPVQQWIKDILHMGANRIFTAQPRVHEAIAGSLLERWLRSFVARNRATLKGEPDGLRARV